MPQRLASLPEVEAAIWGQLDAAVADRGHAWRTPVLATTDGQAADARTVVIREVDTRNRLLLFYTDQRAAKVAHLLSHPLGTLAMWSPALNWQLRCRVRLSLEDDGLAVSSRWAHIKLSPAAQDYLSPLPPGAPLQPAAPGHDAVPRAHFAVVIAQVTAIDWLELHADGHRRALFDAGQARWVQP